MTGLLFSKVHGHYRTILVDPPWPYEQKLRSSKTRGGIPYKTMSVEDIGALPVGWLAAPESMLWLWTTNTHLLYAFPILESWGFEYVTMVTWAKTQFGLGYWLRGQTEHCILAVKGRPRRAMKGPHGATGMNWSTLITAPRQRHSEKPSAFIDMIEALGEPPRLELFAQRTRLGWDSWGEEVVNTAALQEELEEYPFKEQNQNPGAYEILKKEVAYVQIPGAS